MSTLFYEEDLAFHRALVRANEAIAMKNHRDTQLNDNELTRIQLCWERLCETLRNPRDNTYTLNEILSDTGTIIRLCHDVERAITEGRASATARAVHSISGPRVKRSAIKSGLTSLLATGATLDDLQEALNQMRADKPLISPEDKSNE